MVKIILVLLVLVLLGGAVYAFISQLPERTDASGFNPQGSTWVPLNFKSHGIQMDVPGSGWNLYYHAESQLVVKDDVRGTFEVIFVGAIALNPDSYRVDNKPEVFRVLHQESIRLQGWGEEVLYTVAQGNEDGYIANKHQLYFRRTFRAANGQSQTYTYLITLTCPSGLDAQYLPVFTHIRNSIQLYEYE